MGYRFGDYIFNNLFYFFVNFVKDFTTNILRRRDSMKKLLLLFAVFSFVCAQDYSLQFDGVDDWIWKTSNSAFDIELFFASVSQSVGATNTARNVSDADWATCKVLGRITLDSSADNYNYGGGRVHNFDRQSQAFAGGTILNERFKSRFPIILQADSNSTSVYCFAFLTGDDVTPDFSVGDLEVVLGIEY